MILIGSWEAFMFQTGTTIAPRYIAEHLINHLAFSVLLSAKTFYLWKITRHVIVKRCSELSAEQRHSSFHVTSMLTWSEYNRKIIGYHGAMSCSAPISSGKQAVRHSCNESRMWYFASKYHASRQLKHATMCRKLHWTAWWIYLLQNFTYLPLQIACRE